MPLQDTPRLGETEYRPYRGRDWERIQAKWGGSGPARRRSADRSAPRLGSSTHFDSYSAAVREYPGPSYLAIAKSYGPNGGKVVLRTMHERPNLSRSRDDDDDDKPRRQTAGTPRLLADPINLNKSAWRARSEIEDWIRMTCTPDTDYRLCTATKRGGFESTAVAYLAVAKLRRQIEKHYPGIRILAVPELHLGDGPNHGTYHVHMIVVMPAKTRPIYQVFHRLWYRALGGTGKETGATTPGNFDFARTHGKDGKRYTPCQAARYMAKYVTKHIAAGNVGEKRYTKTHGAPDPVKRYWWVPIGPHTLTRAHMVSSLRNFFPAETYGIFSRTFSDGGDTFHVFSAEPVPK